MEASSTSLTSSRRTLLRRLVWLSAALVAAFSAATAVPLPWDNSSLRSTLAPSAKIADARTLLGCSRRGVCGSKLNREFSLDKHINGRLESLAKTEVDRGRHPRPHGAWD